MACGLLALMVSRGSSMFMEGIEELQGHDRQMGKRHLPGFAACVAGLLLGLDGFMWSESVVINRISLFGVPWLMMVLVCLMRWIYAPHQRRYLYWRCSVFGICATIHQTLLVAAMGIEVAIAAAQPRLGRDVFLATASFTWLLVLLPERTSAIRFWNLGKPGRARHVSTSIGIGSLVGLHLADHSNQGTADGMEGRA